ncbi:hypothetical protein GCM10010913_44940 [Paenibacillus aceti]|uniref:UbiC transcription regulator-associated domain-containing protein n=1 Tax=Paenibacillus aceti TaxID=1820010 RepID=A0ABQ1W7N7_9BACL|nr:hypothetical protein GCM10010913_44940 [Paenibacillus aceti]
MKTQILEPGDLPVLTTLHYLREDREVLKITAIVSIQRFSLALPRGSLFLLQLVESENLYPVKYYSWRLMK